MPARMEQHTLRVRVPSYKRIMHDFDVSRATAYRWRAALLDAQSDGGNG